MRRLTPANTSTDHVCSRRLGRYFGAAKTPQISYPRSRETVLKLLVVIVNYRTAEMTLDAAGTALTELRSYPDARITIVDNASGDGSADRIESVIEAKTWGDRVSLIRSSRNGGFASGCNQAIRPALAGDDTPDYVYLLNSDAFPDAGAIDRLVEYLDTHADAGLAGSYIHGTDAARTPHRTAFRFPSLLGEIEGALGIGAVTRLLERWVIAPALPEETTPVDWLAGASMLIRREVFDSIGLMDERYFLYFEETDFCLRAARNGWPTAYVVESSVAHAGGASTGMQDISSPTPTYWYASRHRYFTKNHGRAALWAANLIYIVCGTIRRARTTLMQRPSHEPRGHMRGFLRYNLLPWLRGSAHPNPPSHPIKQTQNVEKN